MKKLLVFILTSSLIFNAFGDKKANPEKEVYLPSDVTMTIGEYSLAYFLENPKHLVKVALLDKNFCAGIKKLAGSEKLFSKYPEHQTVFIYLRALFGIEKTFEDVCKELDIKDNSPLLDEIIKLLDYLINIYDARVLLKYDAQSYQRLLNFEAMLVKHIAQLFPDRDRLGMNEERQFKQFLNDKILNADAFIVEDFKHYELFIKRLRFYKENRQGFLRLFYLTLIIKEYTNRHPITPQTKARYSIGRSPSSLSRMFRIKGRWSFKGISRCLHDHCNKIATPNRKNGRPILVPRYDSPKHFLKSTAIMWSPELIDTIVKHNIFKGNNIFETIISTWFYSGRSYELNNYSAYKQRKNLISFAVAKSPIEKITARFDTKINRIKSTQPKKRLEFVEEVALILECVKPKKLKKLITFKKLMTFLEEQVAQLIQKDKLIIKPHK